MVSFHVYGVVCFVLFDGMCKWFLFGTSNCDVLNFMDCIVYFIEIEILWFGGLCCELNLVACNWYCILCSIWWVVHVIDVLCFYRSYKWKWLIFCDFKWFSLNCRAYVGHWPQLSFKHIYGQRAQVPGSIIIDGQSSSFELWAYVSLIRDDYIFSYFYFCPSISVGGSGYCKFGWSKYECPSGRSATFLVMILIVN